MKNNCLVFFYVTALSVRSFCADRRGLRGGAQHRPHAGVRAQGTSSSGSSCCAPSASTASASTSSRATVRAMSPPVLSVPAGAHSLHNHVQLWAQCACASVTHAATSCPFEVQSSPRTSVGHSCVASDVQSPYRHRLGARPCGKACLQHLSALEVLLGFDCLHCMTLERLL